jgi:hypothetical protein
MKTAEITRWFIFAVLFFRGVDGINHFYSCPEKRGDSEMLPEGNFSLDSYSLTLYK